MIRTVHALVFLLLTSAAYAQGLRLVGDSWPPYVDEGLPTNGLAVAVVTTALERAGYTPEFRTERWATALEGAKAGLYDGIVAIWYTDERNQTLHFSEPYLENPVYFVKKRGSPVEFTTLEDMTGYRIGAVSGFEYGERIEPLRGSMEYSNYVVQMLLDVISGNVDLAIVERRVANHEMNRYMSNQADELEFIEPPAVVRELRMAVSRERDDHEQVIEDFNRVISEMREDGSIDAIFASYETN